MPKKLIFLPPRPPVSDHQTSKNQLLLEEGSGGKEVQCIQELVFCSLSLRTNLKHRSCSYIDFSTDTSGFNWYVKEPNAFSVMMLYSSNIAHRVRSRRDVP